MKTIKNLIIASTFALLLGVTNQASALQMYPIVDDNYVTRVNHVTTRTVIDEEPAPRSTTTYTTKTVHTTAPTTNTTTTKNVNTTTTNSNNITTPADVRDLPPVVNSAPNGNNIAALSLAGSGGFMPSSIWQWILVVLFILAIIIIARMLSHSHHSHEVHTVTAH